MHAKRRRTGPAPGEADGVHQDYYALLELPRGANMDAIKHAYHKLALRYHPDRNKGNEVECETRFKELAAAYAVLSDPEKRQQYDLSLIASSSSSSRFFQSSDLREVFNQFVSSASTTSFSDFFGSFSSRSSSSFSSRSFSFASSADLPSSGSGSGSGSGLFGHQGAFSFNKKRPPSKGQNLRTTLHVTFNESIFGCTKTIALKTLGWCSTCGGLGVDRYNLDQRKGSANGRTASVDCAACGGTGTYSHRSSVVTINSTCSACGGKGVVVDETTKCKCCHNGRVHQTKELRIEVPAGVMKNMRKVFEGEGDVGEYGGVPGDLIIVFDVEESPLFTREGDDAMCDLSITFFQAALGTRLLVPGLYGQQLPLDIPAGTQPHEVLQIGGEGFANMTTVKRGSLYVRILLDVPKNLSPQQVELLRRAQLQWHEVANHDASNPLSSGDTPPSGDQQPTSFEDTTSPAASFESSLDSSPGPRHESVMVTSDGGEDPSFPPTPSASGDTFSTGRSGDALSVDPLLAGTSREQLPFSSCSSSAS